MIHPSMRAKKRMRPKTMGCPRLMWDSCLESVFVLVAILGGVPDEESNGEAMDSMIQLFAAYIGHGSSGRDNTCVTLKH